MDDIKREGSSRILYIDVLRIVSIFAVIVLHVSAPFLANMNSYGLKSWWAGNIIDSATRWCVPVLIMISGRLMLSSTKEIKIRHFLKKRLTKILLPLVFWSFIYMIWNNRSGLEWNLDLFLNFGRNFYQGNVHIHLWYLYMLVGLYLITPVIKIFVNKAKESSIAYFLMVWFLANGLIGFLEKFIDLKTNFNFSFFHWSIGFYVLGVFLDRLLDKEDICKKVIYFFYLLGFIGLGVTILGTYVFTKNNDGIYVPHFYSYFAPNVIFMSTSIFIFFKRIKWDKFIKKDSFLYKLTLNFSSMGFGIYLVHLLVLDIMESGILGLGISPFDFNPVVGIFLVSVVTFFLSYFLTVLIQKVPILKMIIPK